MKLSVVIHAIPALPSLRQEGSVGTPQSEIWSKITTMKNSRKKKQIKAVSDLYQSLKRKKSFLHKHLLTLTQKFLITI